MPRRKAVPDFDVPTELWQLALMHPKQLPVTAAIGASVVPRSCVFYDFIVCLVARMLATGASPWLFYHSNAWLLKKKIEASDCSSWRLIHGFHALSKAFFRCLYDVHRQAKFFDFQFGGIKKRGRMEPILGKQILAYRAKRADKICVQDFHDLRSAFQSVSIDRITSFFEHSINDNVGSIFKQFFSKGTFHIQCGEELVFFQLFDGIMAGGPLACDIFNVAMLLDLKDWIVENSFLNQQLCVQSVVKPFKHVYLGSCFFVDDIANTLIENSSASLDALLEKRKICHSALDASLGVLGAIRNVAKEQSILHVPMSNTRSLMKQARMSGFSRVARYLGPDVSDNSSFVHERLNRVRAASKNWHTYYAFWTSDTPFKFKKIVFRSLITTALITGAETFVLSPFDYCVFDKILARRLRVLMKGKACSKSLRSDGSVRFSAMTNLAVLKFCRVLPTYIEVPISNLKMVQRWCGDLEHNQWILTIFFSPCLPFEDDAYDFNNRPCSVLHPWAKQLLEHILLLSNVEGGESFLESLNGDMMKLIWVPEITEAFLSLNISELEPWWLSLDPPPPPPILANSRSKIMM